MNGTTAYALSKQYVANTVDSLGAVKGANCTIKSTTKIGGDSIVTFEWTGTSGTKQTSSITVSDGVSITSIDIDSGNNLVCTMSDGTEQKAKINILDNVYTKSETNTLLLDKAEKTHNHNDLYASKDTEHEHSNKETLDKFGVNDGGKLTFNGDVVTPEAMDLGDYLKKTDAQNTYVEKETGKGLSENDFTTVLKDAYDKAVEDSHTHSNKSIIDKFSESADGKLLYDGQSIEADLSTVYKKTETYSQTEADNKFVAKESGKGLSANDLTNELKSSYDDAVTAKHTHDNKTVLDGITAEKVEAWDKAEANVQSDWNETDDSADGFIKNKPTIPDAYDDTALSGRVKSVEDEVPNLATKTYVGEQIANSEHLKREIVTVLPSDEDANDNIIYMLKVESATGNDKYKEYMKIDGTVQMVGDTSVDLTDYAKTVEIPTTVAELSDSADYAKKTDLHSHDNKTVLDGITSTKVSDWDSAKTHADSAHAPSNAQENVLETVKINNQEITPDENKAVNIDLSGYASHDEIVGENIISYPYANTNKSMNGIEFVDNGDGTVTATGTATDNAYFYLSLPMTLKAGTYVFSNNGLVDSAKVHMQIYLYETPFTTIKSTTSNVSPFTIESDCNVTIRLNVLSGETVDNYIFKPMLEYGSIVHEYQPYNLSREALRTDIDNVADLASRVDNQFSTASGDSITVNDSVDGKLVELGVKGKSIQNQYTGKNLITYPFSQTTQTKYGVTFTDNKNGSINISGTQDGSTTRPYMGLGIWWNETDKKTGNIPIPANTDFTISSNCGSNTAGLRYYIYDESGAKLADNTVYGTSTKTLKFDVEVWVALCVETAANGAVYSCECKPQLELGTTATEYEPYVGGIPSPNPSYPQAINSVGDDGSLVVKSCGKNLIPYPYNDTIKTYNGLTMTAMDDGTIIVNGTQTDKTLSLSMNAPTNKESLIKLDRAKTYAYFNSAKTDTKSKITLGIRLFKDGDIVSYTTGHNLSIGNNGNSDGAVIVTGYDYAYVYLYSYMANQTFDNLEFKPMLVKVNEDATYLSDYEPYKGSTTTIPLSEPLRAIGDVKDEITYQDGKWGVLRRIGKYVMDGTENFILDSDHIADCGISVKMGNYTNILNGISVVSGNTRDMVTDYLGCRELDHIPYYDSSSTIDRGSGIYRTAGNVWLTFGAADIEKMGITKDLDSVKTWLSSHNITVHYPLGTPTFAPFADQTLPYLSTYDGVTNISNDDTLSAEMTVKYPTTDASGVGSRNESRIADIDKNKVDKSSVVTTLGSSSTDTQVPSAKAVWNKSKNKIQRLLDGVDIIVYADSISNEMATDTVRIMNATNSPYGVDNVNNDFHYTIYNINDNKYKRILAYDIRKNDMYMIVKNNNIWGAWAKLATMDKIGSTDISAIGDGTVTGAISTMNDSLNQIGNCELIKEVSGSTSYNWNIKDISKYSWLTFSYSSNFITVPYLVFKTVGSCIVKLGSIYNNENLKATFTYVSDTNITISASQGSTVRLFGIK